MKTLNRNTSKVTTNTGQKDQARRLAREGLQFAFRIAHGLVALSSSDEGHKLLEALLADIIASKEITPEEIKTISELVCPDDWVGGIEQRPTEENPERRAKLQESREYIGAQIRSHRNAAGFTQAELASRAGIPQSHVCRLERGKHAPSHITIDRIAEALGVRPALIDPSRSDATNL